MKIKEVIVVEGRDDTAAIRRAVEAMTIETHGFGMPDEIWPMLERAYETRGLIVFTDPDYAGEKIRKQILARFPDCKQAFLPRGKALKRGNIGVENAAPADIRQALAQARCTAAQEEDVFSDADLAAWDLAGSANARARRERLGELLSIGYGNSKQFLRKLNRLGVSRAEFLDKVRELE